MTDLINILNVINNEIIKVYAQITILAKLRSFIISRIIVFTSTVHLLSVYCMARYQMLVAANLLEM